MVFTVQVLQNQVRLDAIPGQIESVKEAINELNVLITSGVIEGRQAVSRSKALSTQINQLQAEQRRLQEENTFLIQQLGFNPINELDTEREEKIIIPSQNGIIETITQIIPTQQIILPEQNNTLRNALIIGGVLLLI